MWIERDGQEGGAERVGGRKWLQRDKRRCGEMRRGALYLPPVTATTFLCVTERVDEREPSRGLAGVTRFGVFGSPYKRKLAHDPSHRDCFGRAFCGRSHGCIPRVNVVIAIDCERSLEGERTSGFYLMDRPRLADYAEERDWVDTVPPIVTSSNGTQRNDISSSVEADGSPLYGSSVAR